MRGRALALALVAAGLLASAEALARVGGGESFGTGGSSGGGGSYGGGSYGGGSSGGDGGDIGFLIYLWIRFCIAYPQIGIPVTLVGFGFFATRALWSKLGRTHRVVRAHGADRRPRPSDDDLVQVTGRPGQASLDALRESDPGFSMPVLQEFLALVHRRALEAACTKAWDPLAPFVAESVAGSLGKRLSDVKEIHEVVHAGLRVERVEVGGSMTKLAVVFLHSRREVLASGTDRRVYVEERWTFWRAAGAASLPPDDMLRMGCPSCGAAVETDRMGRCGQCGTAVTKGQLQWQAIETIETVRRPVQPPQVSMSGGGDEPSVRFATRTSPDLGTQWRKFTARHPDFALAGFKEHAGEVFVALQGAWSDGEWSRARPYCTDPLFQTLRFYMEQYTQAGLKNRLSDVVLDHVEVVKVEQDAWYEAITIRLWASMKDWVEDERGKVVGGNAKVDRKFSEYWTFLRATGTGAASKDAHHCPSCGAPLDRVSAAGVCGYCDTKITTGRFDWVLSRIDQAETYPG